MDAWRNSIEYRHATKQITDAEAEALYADEARQVAEKRAAELRHTNGGDLLPYTATPAEKLDHLLQHGNGFSEVRECDIQAITGIEPADLPQCREQVEAAGWGFRSRIVHFYREHLNTDLYGIAWEREHPRRKAYYAKDKNQ